MFAGEDDCAISRDYHTLFQMSLNGTGEYQPFYILADLLQPLRGELVIHPHDILLNDLSLIEVFGGIVCCCANHLDPPLICSQIGVCSLKSGKKCMMNIDNTSFVGVDKLGRQYLHIPSKYYKVNMVFTKEIQGLIFLFLFVRLLDGKAEEWDIELIGNILKIRVIADDKRDLAFDIALFLPGDEIIETVGSL